MKKTGKTCRFHGSAGGRPPTHGKYSLINELARLTKKIALDPDHLTLKEEISLNSARITQLIEKLDDKKAAPNSEDMMKRIDDAVLAVSFGERPKALEGLAELREFFEAERAASDVWDEIKDHLALAEKLSRTERSMEIKLEQMVPLSEVTEVCRWFSVIVLRYVKVEDRKQFMQEFRDAVIVTPMIEVDATNIENTHS
jgi:hypothetical protein